MIHELRVIYNDETRIVEVKPDHILSDRFLCYAMLGFAHEIVVRNGLNAPAFAPEQKPQPAGASYAVPPVRTYITPPEE